MMTSINTANINFKWDPKSLEIRTLAVERLLEPLVAQVTTLVNSSNKGPSNKKKGRSKKAHVLAASVETATQNFLEKGEKIAKESQFLKDELTAAVEDVRKQGESMKLSSGEFAEDPCSSMKRGNMVRAARALLSAVTHLLVLADMADVYQLLLQLKLVEESLVKVRNAGTEQDLGIQYKALKPEVDKLNVMAAKRQQELKDVHHKDQMAAARGVLQRNVPMLYTASRACLQHPDVAAYKANRDLIYKQLQHAVSGISNAAQATSSEDSSFSQSAGGGELAYALNSFDKQIIVDPLSFSEERFRPSLEERLESIISGAALMADSSCTRDDRRERIVAECNSVRQALQDLLSEYMGNAGHKEKSDALNTAIDRMTKKTRDLRRQLRKAVMDHVSDSFLETNVPLLVLIEAAKNGNEKEVKEYAQVFREHANKLIETPEELDDSDFETEDFDSRSRTSVQTEDDQLIAGQSARAIMAQLPQEQKAKIAEQVASFQEEKSKLDAEVSKWDDSGNDIIVLAKQMCMIMMEMTDFTRGKGPLKNTSDVISAAKKIAEAGSRMDKLGRAIADQCPDSACKQDLLAYLQRIALYCHQLNICSKVKAEVQNLGGELVVSGVDSAMSLIQAAKNLMNSVVSTVKASYVASTKYQKSQGMQNLNMPAISWKMKAPEKKPLVKREKQDDGQTNKVKRSSQKKHINPVQALSEFKAMDSI
ncbi:catenin alpha-1-like [Sinocyclocheilus grahami]|uniref:catenin alpha-1-like n=1 Tax=Sinocyclocheilus grahami TaxID=75366 RepID=UPI0007AD0A29|nr:PREDICTED: catenin alpha-1-like [Sinocyclocheilus grahami]